MNKYIIDLSGYNKEIARTARQFISFDPEKRAEQQEKGELSFLNDFKDNLFKLINSDSEEEMKLYISSMDYFINKYVSKLNEMNSAQSRTASSMITWPANFRVTTKANASYENRVNEILEIPKKTESYFKKQLKRIRTQEAGGEIAIKQAELDKLLKQQANIKTINKICLSVKKSNLDKIIECEKLNISNETLTEIKEILWNEDGKAKIFASFSLTNLNNRIKSRQDFINKQEKISNRIEEAGAITKISDYRGGEIIQDLEVQRINIIFDWKPEQDIINEVKKHGFRWSPKFMQWTRKLTPNALYSVRRLIEAGL